MQVKLPEEVLKWCIYNDKTFKRELKKDVPEEIKKKIKEYKNKYTNGYFLSE